MEEAWIGIDLGTSSVKCLALSAAGLVLASSQHHYSITRPQPGWAEQDPHDWWHAVCAATTSLMETLGGRYAVQGIGLSGQMHGLVLVDAKHQVVRPAIIWSDARGEREVQQWRDSIGDDEIEAIAGFRSASGMAGISLAWLRKNEAETLVGADVAMQPKDYVRLRLTDRAGVDPTDAGASLLFDLDAMAPSPALVEAAGIAQSLIPPLVPTLGVAGFLTKNAALETGLPEATVVAGGGSDQSMTALGLGLRTPDRAAISLSSGGTAIVPLPPHETVPRGYHRLQAAYLGCRLAMGVVLAAGLATDWLAQTVGQPTQELLDEAADAQMDEGLMALPDLGGTRTPQADSNSQGAFAGIGFHHRSPHLMRALVESVAVSLTDALAAMQTLDSVPREIVISGGGARYTVWRQAVADAAGVPVIQSSDSEHAALGAALAGATATGTEIHFDPQSRIRGTTEPNLESAARLLRVRDRRAALLAACIPSTPDRSQVT